MRFLSIICLAGMCGLAVTMLFHLSKSSEESNKKFWAPYLVCLLIAMMGGIGFGLTWNAERERSIQVERLKISYESQQKRKR